MNGKVFMSITKFVNHMQEKYDTEKIVILFEKKSVSTNKYKNKVFEVLFMKFVDKKKGTITLKYDKIFEEFDNKALYISFEESDSKKILENRIQQVQIETKMHEFKLMKNKKTEIIKYYPMKIFNIELKNEVLSKLLENKDKLIEQFKVVDVKPEDIDLDDVNSDDDKPEDISNDDVNSDDETLKFED